MEQQGRLRRHETSAQEVADLLRIVDDGLADARVELITVDRRFCAAYDAGRALADVVLRSAGYRTVGSGRHVTVFEALPLVLGEDCAALGTYLDTCRAKRNVAEYDRVGEIMSGEVTELIEAVEGLRDEVLEWLEAHRPEPVQPQEEGKEVDGSDTVA